MALRGVSAHARATPDKVALIAGGRTLTYSELDDRSSRLARVLADMGVPGRPLRGREPRPTPVATVLPNDLEILETATAASMLGSPYLPINWHLKAEELGFVLADSGARIVVTDSSLAGHVEEALGWAPSCHALVVGGGYEEAIRGASEAGPRFQATAGPRFMFYTSGTTARPKGVVQDPATVPSPERALAAQEGQVALWWWTPGEVYVMTGPAYHAAHGGWASTALFVGAKTVVMPNWDARGWLASVARYRGSRSFMVPAHFIRLLEIPEPERRRYDISSLRLIVHAAAPCPASVKRRVMAALPGVEVHELYGASEGGATRISPQEWLQHPGSVGRPWPGVQVRILDDQGRAAPPRRQGVIHIVPAGGARFHYHNDPGKTDEAWRGDAFTVGDVGYLDEEGYLYITDRQSDMILWGGVNVAPREIEDVLYSHPQVVDCAVFGIPDERDGEHIKAMVELRGEIATEQLAAHVRTRLADYKVPHVWELVDGLPRDPNGKVLKRLLREAHWGTTSSRP